MKKKFFATALFTFWMPLTALASYTDLGTANLDVFGQNPNVASYKSLMNTADPAKDRLANWAGDYEYSKYQKDTANITTPNKEIFCVSKQNLDPDFEKYHIYTSDYLGNNAGYVTWVANWAAQGGNKIVAQAAIWKKLSIFPTETQYIYSSGVLLNDAIANLESQYKGENNFIDRWLVAVNLADNGFCDIDGQDFLIQASPVPVPSSVLLLGSGLLGLVAAGRRKQH